MVETPTKSSKLTMCCSIPNYIEIDKFHSKILELILGRDLRKGKEGILGRVLATEVLSNIANGYVLYTGLARNLVIKVCSQGELKPVC